MSTEAHFARIQRESEAVAPFDGEACSEEEWRNHHAELFSELNKPSDKASIDSKPYVPLQNIAERADAAGITPQEYLQTIANSVGDLGVSSLVLLGNRIIIGPR